MAQFRKKSKHLSKFKNWIKKNRTSQHKNELKYYFKNQTSWQGNVYYFNLGSFDVLQLIKTV